MSDKPTPAELEFLRTEAIMKARNYRQTGEMSATGIFRDKNEKPVGNFLVQISGNRSIGIEPRYYIEVVQRVLDELKDRLK